MTHRAWTISPVSTLYSGTFPVANPIATTFFSAPGAASSPSGGKATAVGTARNSIVCFNSAPPAAAPLASANRYSLLSSVPTAASFPDDETAPQVGLLDPFGNGRDESDRRPLEEAEERSCASEVVARRSASEDGAADAMARGCAPVDKADEL